MLDVNHGILSYYEVLKVTGAPRDPTKSKNDSVDKLFFEMELLELGIRVADEDGHRYLVYPKYHKAPWLIKKHNEQMAVEAAFVPDILRMLQRINLISNIGILYRRKTDPHQGVVFNNYSWDAIGFTRTTGINEGRSADATTKEKQTVVVLDIVVGRSYTDIDLQGFYSRIQSNLNSVKTGKRKVLPVVVYAKAESKTVINRMHRLGMMSFDLGTIYGSNVFRIIKGVQALKADRDPDQSIERVIEDTLELIENSGQNENLVSIKGDLFEALMYPVFRDIFSGADIVQGRELKQKQEAGTIEKYEYDYIINSSRLKETIVVELKGYSTSNYISLGDADTRSTIKWFFSRTLPFARKMLLSENSVRRITACYITTGRFSEEGIEHMEMLQQSKLKSDVIDVWYDGEKLVDLLTEHKMDHTLRLIRKHFTPDRSPVTVPPFVPNDDPIDPIKEAGLLVSLSSL